MKRSFQGLVGLARRDITPPLGIYSRNWGAAEHDVAGTIHRPLTLTALRVSAGEDGLPLVLIDADLGWWRPLEIFRRFQRRLLDELQIDSTRLIFALTHTHASAPLMDPDPSLPGSELIGPWMESIYQAALSAVKEASSTSFAATIDWQLGRCQLAAVRDFPDPDRNQDRMICGFNPEAVADDTLLVGRVSDQAGRTRATIVNYACHPTTLAWENTSISPDYIGAMRATIESEVGGLAIFLLGACGELAPRYQYVGDAEVADGHGRQLGHAALATLYDMPPPGTCLEYQETVESGAPLAVWRPAANQVSRCCDAIELNVDLPLKDWPTAEELERQRAACEDRALEERLRRRRDIRRALGDGNSFAVPIHGWRIGDLIVVGSCCEAYSTLQQQLRSTFADRMIVCMNLINGTIGYLPPAELYDVDVYPVWQTPFAQGSLERMIDAMQQAIGQLQQREDK